MPTLEWIGKEKVVNHHLEVPYHVLNRIYSYDENGEHEEDNGSENMIIHGDNLIALKSLLPKYEGRIKCIYIDPPYNTGNEVWVYNDNVNDPQIKKWLGEVVGKEGEDLSRHDKWLCMMYPRLKLLQRLLSKDGAIFISIDDNEQASLKFICNEIFGINNFLANIVWKKKTNGNNQGFIPGVHDFIVAYAKSINDLPPFEIPLSEDYIKSNYSNPDNDPRGSWTTSDLSANHKGPYFPITNEKTGETFYPPEGRYWVFNEDDVAERIKDGRIIFGKSGNARPVQKVFARDRELSQSPDSWFDSQGYNSDGMTELGEIIGKKSFDNPKPVSLIEYILGFATDSSSIVLDSFAGSATTAQAVLNLNKKDNGNRKFILVEMGDYAEKITAERIKCVIHGYYASQKAKLYDVAITIKNLKKGNELFNEAKKIAENAKKSGTYDDVKGPKIIKGRLQVIGKSKEKLWHQGTGGNFNFFELGPCLFSNGLLNEKVDTNIIRQYVYFLETKQNIPCTVNEQKYYLGSYIGTAYYLYYEKESVTTLSRDFLHSVKTKADYYVIYADLCTLSSEELEKFHITFKKIPRDIARL